MITIDDLIYKIKSYAPQADLDLVRLAYDYAQKAHGRQKRLSGEPYIQHPLAVAVYLAEMKLGPEIILAGLLHDVPEETNPENPEVVLRDIKHNFGEDVAFMVRGITKLGKIKYRGMERYLENLRKMFVAMAEDVRVIFIKFADRLHNLETLEAHSPAKQKRIAMETTEIYAPIANRLGMGEIKGRLEDLSFKYLYPKEYEELKKEVAPRFRIKEDYLKKIRVKLLKNIANYSGPQRIRVYSIHGRTKRLWSIYKKLKEKNSDLTKIYDLVALRVIVDTVAECYATLGIIHQLWKPLKGRIKDYIAQPKPNGYQSLHTTVFCDNGEIVEFQIRTKKMHEEAEYGIAAHWYYDERGAMPVGKDLKWVKELTKWKKEFEENQKYLESLKLEVFQNRIFVFTPKGDVIDLPEDSTPVDFAYTLHSDLGTKCIGAKINEQLVKLDTKLKSGDVVEILIDKNRKAPSADWLKFVKTRHAKQKIKSTLRNQSNIVKKEKLPQIELKIIVHDRIGLLKDITAVFSHSRVNIAKIATLPHPEKNFQSLKIVCGTNDKEKVAKLISKLKKIDEIKEISYKLV
jgi:GTP pyrophosphokinase